MFFFFQEPERLQINLKTARSFPLWSYGTYLANLDLTYRKLLLLDRLSQLVADGVPDTEIFVSKGSIEPIPPEEISYEDFSEYESVGTKDENPRSFWSEIARRKRPAVFYRDGKNIKPVLPIREGSLELLEATVRSPGDFSIMGIPGHLANLFFGYEENRRRQELHDQQMTTEMLRQMELLARLQSHANDSRDLPPGYRQYHDQVLDQLIDRHKQTARKLDIRVEGVDLIV